MKIGIISDIHSNKQALDTILKEFDNLNVDKIICAGDIIGIGINPDEVTKTLINRKDKLIIVKGNHEKYLLNGIPKVVHNNRNMNEEEYQNHIWNHSKLTTESISFIKTFKDEETIIIEGKKIYITHYPLNPNGTYQIISSKNDIKDLFSNIDADIFIYGHTHKSNILIHDNKYYINPGSLGCPNKTNLAQGILLEINDNNIEFNHINIEYNVKEVINNIKETNMPFSNEILEIFYGQ